MDFHSSIVLITGASRGIGKYLALEFIQEGATVYGTSRNPETIPENEKVPGMIYLPLDVTDESSIEKLYSSLPKCDILINNAGRSQIGSVEETTSEQAAAIFQLNYFGPMSLIQKYIPTMRQNHKGMIINISSLAGKSPVPFSAIYASTKAALDAFSQDLRYELSPFGITVSSIAPSSVKTSIPQDKNYSDNSPYLEAIKVAKHVRDEGLDNASGPDQLAKEIMMLLKKGNLEAHHAVGDGAKFLSFMIKHASNGFLEKQVRKRYRIE